ncbi:MAG TPA: hypothetical protein PLR37_04090 [Candidatus Accumulibacter phosphatis]|nr:hypothetical protein [Candidatus Accumulibacter phosphatis]
MAEAGAGWQDGAPGAGAGAAAGSGQAGTDSAPGGSGTAAGSLLASGQAAGDGGQGTAGGAAAAPSDWLQEKYRVAKADGTLDLEASARKVAEAHRSLEQRLGSGDVPPKTTEEYAPKVDAEGFNWDEVKNDESMRGFLKGAHAKGFTNDQLSYVLGEYWKAAPNLVTGAQQLDDRAATAELRQEWKTDAEFKQHIGQAFKAFNAFAAEADRSRIDEIGNNPIVLRLLANIGKEMREDTPINGGGIPEGDFNTKAAALRGELEKLPPSDPRRKQLKDELDGLYTSRYGARAQRLGGGASRATVA